MALTLTNDDLQAIRFVVNEVVQDVVPDVVIKIINERVPAIVRELVEPMFEEQNLVIAAAFAEVHQILADHTEQFAIINARFEAVDARFEAVGQELVYIRNAFDRTELIQHAEVERVDRHEVTLKQIQIRLKLQRKGT